MNKLDSHIRNTVLLAMVVVITLILSLELVFRLVEEFADMDDGYTLLNALTFTVLTTPTNIYELLPFAALGGALIGLGVLASNNELVVMQTAGIRTWRILLAVLKPTAGVMLLSLVLGEYLAPPLEQRAVSNKAIQQSAGLAFNNNPGSWNKINNNFLHINAIVPGGEVLYGLSRYELDDERHLHTASFAESARYVRDSQQEHGGYWLLSNVQRSLLTATAVQSETVAEEVWQVDLSPERLSVLLVELNNQSISGLWEFARFFEAQGAEASSYYLAFWKKLLQPLATLVLVVLGTAFVFGPLREVTMGYRVFVALGVGLVFTIVQRLLEPASLLYGFSPLLAVLTPIFICAALGSFLLLRTN
ncbi:MAG: LPS export ABC transporter permease LptG [Pseudohongiellaceae bacterium]